MNNPPIGWFTTDHTGINQRLGYETLSSGHAHTTHMHHHKANDGKVVDPEWHRFRQNARENAFSPEEFSDIDRGRYNLDDDDPVSPAGITGEDNPRTYIGDSPGIGPTTEHDIRDDPTR